MDELYLANYMNNHRNMHTFILVSCATDYYSLLYVPVLEYIDCVLLRTLHISNERKTVMAAHTRGVARLHMMVVHTFYNTPYLASYIASYWHAGS